MSEKDLYVLVTNQEEPYGNGFLVAGWDPDTGAAFYEDNALELLANLIHEGGGARLYKLVPVESFSSPQLNRLHHFMSEAEKDQEELSA